MHITTHDAEISGAYAAMDPPTARDVPAEFKSRLILAAAWLEGYDRMATSQQCQRPGVLDAPAPTERAPRKKIVKTRPAAAHSVPKVHERPSMLSILEGSFVG